MADIAAEVRAERSSTRHANRHTESPPIRLIWSRQAEEHMISPE
jgi:hypothetical protein